VAFGSSASKEKGKAETLPIVVCKFDGELDDRAYRDRAVLTLRFAACRADHLNV
jgi:hypothetical protein